MPFVSRGRNPYLRPSGNPPPPPADLITMTQHGIHPSIAAAPPVGRKTNVTFYDSGRVYLGYGDWSANTGPTDVAYWTVADWTSGVAITAPTEAIEQIRRFGSSLYVPWIDSHPTMPYLGFSTNVGGTWHHVDNQKYGALHIFDVATYDGTDIYMVGADIINNQGYAVVYRSADGDGPWTLELQLGPGGEARLHSLIKIGSNMYAAGSGWSAEGGQLWKFNGSTWAVDQSPYALSGSRAWTLDGLLISLFGWFDGTTTHAYAGGLYLKDVYISATGELFGLGIDGVLYSGDTTTGVVWTRIGIFDYLTVWPSAIAIDGTNLYVGGANGQISSGTVPT